MNGLNEYTEEKRIYSGFESVFAWLCLLLGYLFCRSASALHLALISLCVNSLTLLALYKKGIKIKAKSLFLCLLSLAFSFRWLSHPSLRRFYRFSARCYCIRFFFTAHPAVA